MPTLDYNDQIEREDYEDCESGLLLSIPHGLREGRPSTKPPFPQLSMSGARSNPGHQPRGGLSRSTQRRKTRGLGLRRGQVG